MEELKLMSHMRGGTGTRWRSSANVPHEGRDWYKMEELKLMSHMRGRLVQDGGPQANVSQEGKTGTRWRTTS